MDGPVVQAAQRALATGDVSHALVWVPAADEDEVGAAFARVQAVRGASGEARELADRWFFETVVRLHRAGEGAPYTGLKPAGHGVTPGVAGADRALERGSLDALSSAAAGHLVDALRERFERVRSLESYAPRDVAAGRRYVEAYVEFVHFVEAVHAVLSGAGGHAHPADG